MNQFVDKMSERLMPLAGKMGSNKFLIAIRDGITLAMPLILIGSVLMVIATGFAIPGLEAFISEIGLGTYLWKAEGGSFELLGMIAAFGIAHSLAKQYNVDGISAGIVSLSCFMVVTPLTDGNITAGYMGGKGLFVAIILGLINGWVYQWFINHNIQIKLPETVPPAVSKSFSAIIPGTVLILAWTAVYGILDAMALPNLHDVARTVLGIPLGLLGNNLPGVLLVCLFNSLFWFVGLHGGNTVNKIMEPIWLVNLSENVEAARAGMELKHIFVTPFVDNFVFIGGCGATIGLILSIAYLSRKKKASKQMKALSPLTLVPGLFNINEPTMFGVPVVLNIMLLIPFVLAPMVNCIISYMAMAAGLVPFISVQPGWTTPPIFSGFLATGSIMGAVLQIILILIDILVYLPFVMNIEKRFQEEEQI